MKRPPTLQTVTEKTPSTSRAEKQSTPGIPHKKRNIAREPGARESIPSPWWAGGPQAFGNLTTTVYHRIGASYSIEAKAEIVLAASWNTATEIIRLAVVQDWPLEYSFSTPDTQDRELVRCRLTVPTKLIDSFGEIFNSGVAAPADERSRMSPLQDLPAEVLLSIVDSETLEDADVSRLMQACRGLYDFLHDYSMIRSFRALCAESTHGPCEIFWALKDVLKSFDAGVDASLLFPLFRAALMGLRSTGAEELLIPIIQARALEGNVRKRESELLHWLWDQFHPRPATLLPIARRLQQLSPTEGTKAEMQKLEREGLDVRYIRLVPYTAAKPRFHGEWIKRTNRWHHASERDVVVALSKRSPLSRRLSETLRKYNMMLPRRRERKGARRAAMWRQRIEAASGLGLEV
ncbi:hypothetical protein NKR23_g8976 [Pleurostoma richardsiae]|uniref:F-box domain-containing protein n=1 Tax=Pleurostoma richardsiae TaxID=41990 RepID=A0AA38VKB3_9PEZI|nr:hypothetical protein NKR23_g8976 [Pleurostoma richardsiae]